MKRATWSLMAGITIAGLAAGILRAGGTNAPAPPTDPTSAMVTLEDLYQHLTAGTSVVPRAGGFAEPAIGPAPTGHTLREVMEDGIIPQRTGQTATRPTTAVAGSDGARRLGIPWPNPRFTDNGNGTVTDQATGLVWLRNANAYGTRVWTDAMADCAALQTGVNGLTDGSAPGDWRLPNVLELQSLLAYQYLTPALTDGTGTNQWTEAAGPFTAVQSAEYWSSSVAAATTARRWFVRFIEGYVTYTQTYNLYYVWPVRGGR